MKKKLILKIGAAVAGALAFIVTFGMVGQLIVSPLSQDLTGRQTEMTAIRLADAADGEGYEEDLDITIPYAGMSAADRQTNGDALAELIEGEGMVLVKNAGNTLPLAASVDKINVFGWSSSVWVAGGSGSGRVIAKNGSAFAEIGINEAIKNYTPAGAAAKLQTFAQLETFYKGYAANRPNYSEGFERGTLKAYDYGYSRLIEPKMTDYSDTLKTGAEAFTDTAIVVLSRVAGESNDSPKVQYKGATVSATPADTTRHYLEISTEEEELLKYVGEKFKNTVVLINSTNPMQLNFMDEIPGLDACLVVGATGMKAASAIPKVLYGEINPSGRTADTLPYDFRSSSTWANFGHAESNGASPVAVPEISMGQHFYTGTSGAGLNGRNTLYPIGDGNGNFPDSAKYQGMAYIDYQETIYVGYKWYETADAEGYWAGQSKTTTDGSKTGYDAVVQYPFGFGLSYTNFEWDIYSAVAVRGEQTLPIGSALEKNDKIKVEVRVSNKGTKPGKDVVQVYVTPPYTKGVTQIEKAAVNLVGFAKTPIIPAGQNRIVSIEFDAYDMASYDMRGNGGYVLEAGDYIIKPMANAHGETTASKYAADVSAKVVRFNVAADLKYDKDPGNKNTDAADVKNRFTGDAAKVENGGDGVPLDGSLESVPVQYMTRANFAGTFPNALKPARAVTDAVKALNQFTQQQASDWKTRWDTANPDAPAVTVSNGGKLSLSANNNALAIKLGANYDDPEWDTLLGQMSAAEMRTLCQKSSNTTQAMSSIGKPANEDKDGPNMYGGFVTNATNKTAFPSATVLAQTYNKTLAYLFGLHLGSEARDGNANGGWYAPGVNIHRSQLSGRNYEYYSEDGYLTGIMSAHSIMGVKKMGIYSYMKHLVLHDQDNNRDSLYTWCTEQALREIYLKPFRIAIQQGGATGIMSSYNRVGAVYSGGSEALLTGVIRNEYGFRGAICADWVDRSGFMMMSHKLRAGGDVAINGSAGGGSYAWFSWDTATFQNNTATMTQLRRANKNVSYLWAEAKYVSSIWNPTTDPLLKEKVKSSDANVDIPTDPGDKPNPNNPGTPGTCACGTIDVGGFMGGMFGGGLLLLAATFILRLFNKKRTGIVQNAA